MSHDDQVETLQRSLLGGEVTARTNRPADAPLIAFVLEMMVRVEGQNRHAGVPALAGRPRHMRSEAGRLRRGRRIARRDPLSADRRWLAALPHPFANNLPAKTLKHTWPMVAGMLKSVFEQPDAEPVHRQSREVCAALDGKFPDALELLEHAETDVLAFTPFPVEHWKEIAPAGTAKTKRSDAEPTWSGSSPTAPQ